MDKLKYKLLCRVLIPSVLKVITIQAIQINGHFCLSLPDNKEHAVYIVQLPIEEIIDSEIDKPCLVPTLQIVLRHLNGVTHHHAHT